MGSHTNLNEVDFGKRLVISRFLDIKYRDDVLVVEVSHELHLSQRPQTEHGVVEGGDAFDGDLALGGDVEG